MYAVTPIMHRLEDWKRKPPVLLQYKSILYKLKDWDCQENVWILTPEGTIMWMTIQPAIPIELALEMDRSN